MSPIWSTVLESASCKLGRGVVGMGGRGRSAGGVRGRSAGPECGAGVRGRSAGPETEVSGNTGAHAFVLQSYGGRNFCR